MPKTLGERFQAQFVDRLRAALSASRYARLSTWQRLRIDMSSAQHRGLRAVGRAYRWQINKEQECARRRRQIERGILNVN